jgi:HEAT repeat protein
LAERAEIVSPEDALASYQRMAVLGDPGAGKTTMLRYLALKMDQDAEPKLPYLPVYVELGRFVESMMDDLLDFAAADWDRRYGFPNARPYLEQQLHEGKAALLLDGLDEVLVGATPDDAQKAYKLVADEINRLDTRFSKAPIAVTCRKAGWRGGLKGFQTLEVLDFSWEQIQQFVNNWFKSNPAKAKGLRQALALNLRMQTLAANPLILSVIAIVYEEQLELPERRAELYNRCGEVLLREWDAHRGIKRFSQFTADRKRDLLKEVAWHFHIDGRRYFPETELLHLVAGFLPTIDILPSESKAILEEIAAQYGLLKAQAHGWYGFLHLTFQEYLAALAANEKGATGLQEVVAHRADPWWEEVILLLAGRMNDATPLLLGLLGHSTDHLLPSGELAAKDDLFHSDLLLAARCLEGTPIIRMRGLRDRLLQEVKNLLETSVYKLDWERTAKVLVEIGGRATKDELLAMLADNNIERWKRWRIGSAFEELGDHSIAVGLLELLQGEAELDPLVRGCIVSALAELKATFAVPYLLGILKADEDYGIQENIAEVLGSLGDKSVVPELMEMLRDQKRDECVRSSIALSLGRLGDKSVAPVLLLMLLDKTTAPRMKLAIAQALKDLGDKSKASELLKQLQDETIDWQIRWLLTECLESIPKTIAPLKEMLENPNINQGVRVGIAATLGTWRVGDNIPKLLCEAIESQVVPPNWCLGNHVEIGYVWQRITRTLKSLGDDSVVPALVKAFGQCVSQHDKLASSSKWSDEVKGIIAAACEYQPEAIARQILAMLHEPEWQSSQDHLLESLPQLTIKSLVPELLNLLAERRMYNVSDKIWMGIIQAIAQVADGRETVKALLQMMPAKPSSNFEKHLAQVIYAALYSVSRRAGVRVSRDGQIESLVAATS